MRLDPFSFLIVNACGMVYRRLSLKWQDRLEGCRFQYWAGGRVSEIRWEQRKAEKAMLKRWG
jgi:hypothetical protein